MRRLTEGIGSLGLGGLGEGGSEHQESSALVNRFLKSLPLQTTQYKREKDVMHSG